MSKKKLRFHELAAAVSEIKSETSGVAVAVPGMPVTTIADNQNGFTGNPQTDQQFSYQGKEIAYAVGVDCSIDGAGTARSYRSYDINGVALGGSAGSGQIEAILTQVITAG